MRVVAMMVERVVVFMLVRMVVKMNVAHSQELQSSKTTLLEVVLFTGSGFLTSTLFDNRV